jgi:hypothetical protein
LPYITITDTVLTKNIVNVIDKFRSDAFRASPFKKGMGYVALYVVDYPRKDTLIHYSIIPESDQFKPTTNELRYPDGYSYCKGWLVLIYYDSITREFGERAYTEKTKRKIRKMIDKTLGAPLKGQSGASTHYSGTSIYMIKGKPPILRVEQ